MSFKLKWYDHYICEQQKFPVIVGTYYGEEIYEIYDYRKDPTVVGDKFKLCIIERGKEKDLKNTFATLTAAKKEAQKRFSAELTKNYIRSHGLS